MKLEEIRQSRLNELIARRDDIVSIIDKLGKATSLLQEIIDGYNQTISDIDQEIRYLTPNTCETCYRCNPSFNNRYICEVKGTETHLNDSSCEKYEPLPF